MTTDSAFGWTGEQRLARSVEEIRERMAFFRTPASELLADQMHARPTDVFITTYPKCGTTLLQQMLHCLRTGGDEDFDEISNVVPWFEMCGELNLDPGAEQVATPRVYKTHRRVDNLPAQSKLLHMTRDPLDMADSFYRFFANWVFDSDYVDKDTFVQGMILDGTGAGTYWDHLLQSWQRRDNDNVLFLCYEDFISQPSIIIERVAAFAGIELNAPLLNTTLDKTSKNHMRERAHKFDDHQFMPIVNPRMGLPKSSSTTKVASAKDAQARDALSEQTRSMLKQRWDATIKARFHIDSYAALRELV